MRLTSASRIDFADIVYVWCCAQVTEEGVLSADVVEINRASDAAKISWGAEGAAQQRCVMRRMRNEPPHLLLLFLAALFDGVRFLLGET